jgi:hypothetical protein
MMSMTKIRFLQWKLAPLILACLFSDWLFLSMQSKSNLSSILLKVDLRGIGLTVQEGTKTSVHGCYTHLPLRAAPL